MTNIQQEVPTKLRPIKAIKLGAMLPASILETDEKPEFEWVDPASLYVEEKYQRNLTERSLILINKIIKDFQWSHFKPPVCSWAGDKLVVIDGQHTAIAAASHPKLKKIPVMVVCASTINDRAVAFMGHNKDRLAVTAAQMYYSSVAAGDPVALALKKALDETGCSVARYNPPVWVEGQTMASGTLLKLAANKGSAGVARVLKILMDAKRAPVIAIEISAVADLLWNKDWAGRFDDYDLATVIRSKAADKWLAYAEANVRKGQAIQMKRALAISWFKHVPKITKRALAKQESKIKIKTL